MPFFMQNYFLNFSFSKGFFSIFLLPEVFASLFFFQSQKYEQVRWTCEPKPEKYPFFGKAEGAKEKGFKKKTMLKYSFIISSFRRLLSTFLLPEPKRKVAKENGSVCRRNAADEMAKIPASRAKTSNSHVCRNKQTESSILPFYRIYNRQKVSLLRQ